MIEYRPATERDLQQLAEMRWDYRLEGQSSQPPCDRHAFIAACQQFLLQGLRNQTWAYWVAVEGERILCTICVELVEKVPRPDSLVNRFGYVTNVYARPECRGKGIGSALLRRVRAWAEEQNLEFLIAWPAEGREGFYERAGFTSRSVALECPLRAYAE